MTLQSRRPRQPWMLYQSRRRILVFALVSRLLILSGMMVSNQLIPNHNPGDDVLQFDMRLSSDCFCEEGRACLYDTDGTVGSCYVTEKPSVVRTVITNFYKLMLPPLTRWDAARFLSLAANPEMRQPQRDYVLEWACRESDTPFNVCYTSVLKQTEQAHAFLPFFPTTIRIVTCHILQWIPWILLPPTYEGVLVLVAWWINVISFIFAALSLHELTYCVTKKYAVGRELCIQCAYTSAFIFCFNPASVFFSSAYSESIFAMLTFSGYFFAERNNYIFAIICWVISSYARSNGTMTILWLTLQAIARCLNPKPHNTLAEVISIMWETMFILSPVLYHDWNGYVMHCVEANNAIRPAWCRAAKPIFGLYDYMSLLQVRNLKYFKLFPLYKHVQRKHWNVGLLRYYQWKQLPNFLLAFPVLFLGTCAVTSWIHQSWRTFVKNKGSSFQKNDKWWNKLLRLVQWAMFAFCASSDSPEFTIKELKERDQPLVVLVGPTLLAYYAILGAACIVGATIAHVQISTRFIFASCPAIYWYMASICISDYKENSRSFLARLLLSRDAVVCYCVGFILAGAVMHPNWLPWT